MLTIDIIIGNLCSPLAMITDAISSTRKTAAIKRVESNLVVAVTTLIVLIRDRKPAAR